MLNCRHFARVIGAPEAWPAWVPAGHRRRSDALLRSAAHVVELLYHDGWTPDPATALVVSTSYGAVDATWRFGVSMATHGDAHASPTPFTHSVHNSCAGTINELLGFHTGSTTLSQGQHGTHAALRWAQCMLQSGRAQTVLALIGDRHNPWSRSMVEHLAGVPWPIGDGMVGCVLTKNSGPGRRVQHAASPAELDQPPAPTPTPLQVESGTVNPVDEVLLAAWPGERRQAAVALQQWWPASALAAVDPELWQSPRPLRLAEVEDGRLAVWNFSPWQAQ